jgi:DNA-binding FadR family transcriptional regulator
MLCDACLMLLYTDFKANETGRRVFFALQVNDFPTIEALMKESGVSRHGVREALSCFRGAGLVWGNGCHGLSDDGQRLLKLLRDADQPEPSEALCDECLLEIGQGLCGDEYAVLARLSDRATHSRHNLMMATEISITRLRDVLLALQGARLIQSGRGRVFRLSRTGRRLERLLKSPISNL